MIALLGQFLRFYGCRWDDLMGLRVNVWQAMAEAMPEIDRLDLLREVQALTLAGQRSVSDDDFKATIRKLQQRRKAVLPPGELEKWKRQVERINQAWCEVEIAFGSEA